MVMTETESQTYGGAYVGPHALCTPCGETVTWDARQECYVDHFGYDVCPDENGHYWEHSVIPLDEEPTAASTK